MNRIDFFTRSTILPFSNPASLSCRQKTVAFQHTTTRRTSATFPSPDDPSGRSTLHATHPCAGMGHPCTGMGRPCAGMGHPCTGMGHPCTGMGHPCAGMGHPCAGMGHPCTGMGHPCTGMGHPCTGMGHPCTGMGRTRTSIYSKYNGRISPAALYEIINTNINF
jgi:hypothetical protein